ncbi:tatB, partial [Acrasis kona]
MSSPGEVQALIEQYKKQIEELTMTQHLMSQAQNIPNQQQPLDPQPNAATQNTNPAQPRDAALTQSPNILEPSSSVGTTQPKKNRGGNKRPVSGGGYPNKRRKTECRFVSKEEAQSAVVLKSVQRKQWLTKLVDDTLDRLKFKLSTEDDHNKLHDALMKEVLGEVRKKIEEVVSALHTASDNSSKIVECTLQMAIVKIRARKSDYLNKSRIYTHPLRVKKAHQSSVMCKNQRNPQGKGIGSVTVNNFKDHYANEPQE